ncbi:hypothetical protein TSOC_011202 [Tetrabaena socialis]|uniref:EF-hand domain-containing protein n=1 Tax=Tetrabaena socialis TaxID=47790 RepID=A0A2J7ZRB0_9CHLO|nr:hypothetical protein TSOC_011202 [Tetrabaena socialis]|eukprot:PNH02798.1 hypothetical protein TSOC_011202 [Tetrabaena socialis]
MAPGGPGGPSKAQVDQWNEKAQQLLKRHDQNGDGLLDPREMVSAINELCGTHGFSARSLSPVSTGDLANIFNTAAQRSSGLTLKQFLTALAMISPDLTTLCNHMVAQLGPQMRPRAGGDAPQPATFPLRNLDLKGQAAQASWGSAQSVMSAANAFMKAGNAHTSSGGPSSAGVSSGGASLGGVEIEETLTRTRGASGFASPSHLRTGSNSEPLAPIVGGPITARLGGGGMKRSSLSSVTSGGLQRPQGSAGGNKVESSKAPALGLDAKLDNNAYRWTPIEFSDIFRRAMLMADSGEAAAGRGGGTERLMGQAVDALRDLDVRSEANLKQCYNNYCRLVTSSGSKMMMDGDLKLVSSQWHQLCGDVGLAHPALDMPSNQLVLLDRLAAAEARITQLEQQQSFAREMMQAAGPGAYGAAARPAAVAGEGMSGPHVAAMEAKIAALDAELQRVAPGADAARQVSEVRDSLELLTNRVEALGKGIERATKRVESAEAVARAADEQVRTLSAPVTECNSGLAALRTATDALKAGITSKESELMAQLITRVSGTEAQLETLEAQLRKVVREAKAAAVMPSRESMAAAIAAAGPPAEGAGAPPAPSTPTAGGATDAMAKGAAAAGAAAGSGGGAAAGGGGAASGDYLIQTLGVVQLDTEEEIRLQIKLLCEAMDNIKRRVSQIAGSTYLNPIDFPTRNELSEVKRVIMADMSDIDSKYAKVQKEVSHLSLKMPALEKKVESSALGGGTEVVNRLVSMGMARLADVKETENYMVERGAAVNKQFDNLRRDMQDTQQDLQANMEKLVTQFNQINKQLIDAKRDASSGGVALVAAAVGGNGGSNATAAATAATAASAAATATQTASEARSAVERERNDRERETRELRERLARTESHLGGALGELQTVVGAELSNIKEVLTQLEAAMNQADGDVMRIVRDLDGSLKSALNALERGSGEQNEMTGKVIMKMARQITDMQVKLRELATAAVTPVAHSPLPSPPSMPQQQPQQLQARESDPHVPFAARLLAAQNGVNGSHGGGGNGSEGGGGNAPGSPSLARREYQPRTSTNGAQGLLNRGNERGVTPEGAPGAGGGRNVGQSPARGMLAADPPPPPGGPGRMPRLSDAGQRVSMNGR